MCPILGYQNIATLIPPRSYHYVEFTVATLYTIECKSCQEMDTFNESFHIFCVVDICIVTEMALSLLTYLDSINCNHR